MPAGGEPLNMSEFTLGERYGAADMYRDYPHLKPGDRVAYEKDGIVYTDTVQSVSYSSPEGVAPPARTWWQRMARMLTPARFRKPLPQSPPKPGQITVNVGLSIENPLEGYQHTVEDIQRMIDRIDKR